MSPNGTPEFPASAPISQRRIDPRIVVAAVAALAFLLFIFQNSQDVKVKWLFFDGTAPLWVVILITALLSAISVQLALWVVRRRRKD